MTSAKILTSIEKVLEYLDMVKISYDCTLKRKNLLPGKYSEEYFQTCHSGDYNKKFLVASKNLDYDIILEDGSFFQFTSTSSTDIHYSFLHKIEKALSYNEFIEKYLTEENIDSIAQEYEMYLSTDKKSTYPCPIRYDVARHEYKEGLHACAHLHIGVDSEIRIPFDKIIRPLAFVDFVIKHTYKEKWDKAFITNEKFKNLINNLKNQSEKIEETDFTTNEKLQLYIT